MNLFKSLIVLFIFNNLIVFNINGQWTNKVYKENIKTVYCHRALDKLEPPIIELNTEEKLTLEFDDLNDLQSIYFYKVIHCTWDWKTSDLNRNDYVDGFGSNEIYNSNYSFNTLQDYTHFSVTLPNNYLDFKLSGNYLIQVFTDNNPDSLVLTQRIMVYENETPVSVKVKATAVVADRETKQEVDFTVNTGRLKLFNVFDEIHVVLLQNMRWDNAITNLQPKFLNGNQLIYDFEKENSFDGGNEYRQFDIKDLHYQSLEIAAIKTDSALERVYLHPVEKRTFKRYTTWEDLNGGFLIKKDNSIDSDLEADYILVHFILPFDFPLQNADIHIAGKFTDYQYNEETKMTYDFGKRAFLNRMFIKQGFYNYCYMLVDKGQTTGHMAYIEGSHFQTENSYNILVYYNDSSRFYDRLVGIGYGESNL